MLVAELERQRQRDLIAALDAGERLVGESLGDLLVAPELEPGDLQLLQPWLTWCRDKSVRHAPAKPHCVAAYVLDRHKDGVTETRIFSELAGIQKLHDKFKLSSPVCTAVVQSALERVTKIQIPRWPTNDLADWWQLPPTVRAVTARREQERDAAVRKRMNQIADLKAELKKQLDTAITPAVEQQKEV